MLIFLFFFRDDPPPVNFELEFIDEMDDQILHDAYEEYLAREADADTSLSNSYFDQMIIAVAVSVEEPN